MHAYEFIFHITDVNGLCGAFEKAGRKKQKKQKKAPKKRPHTSPSAPSLHVLEQLLHHQLALRV